MNDADLPQCFIIISDKKVSHFYTEKMIRVFFLCFSTASLSSLSTPIGCLMSGYLMDNFGRKKALLITEIPLMIGWATLALATSVPMLYVGRLLTGLGSGMV